MISLLLLLLLCSACSITSADEAPLVQRGLGEQELGAAEATRGSALNDTHATATAQDIALVAQATAASVEVQLTATAAPVIAAASVSRIQNKANSSNNMTSAVMWTVIITLPMLGLVTVLAWYRFTKARTVLKIKRDELAVIGGYLIDGGTATARPLSDAHIPVMLVSHQVPLLESGETGGRDGHSETSEGTIRFDRHMGTHLDSPLQSGLVRETVPDQREVYAGTENSYS